MNELDDDYPCACGGTLKFKSCHGSTILASWPHALTAAMRAKQSLIQWSTPVMGGRMNGGHTNSHSKVWQEVHQKSPAAYSPLDTI